MAVNIKVILTRNRLTLVDPDVDIIFNFPGQTLLS